jgi:3,4-dihydroxy 2-butanone 4-phosphate synthase/GTP cyclohydrolase II
VTERVPLTPRPNGHNLQYLLTKRDRMGHQLDGLDAEVVEQRAQRATSRDHTDEGATR